jgi:hypothetical protein
MKKIIILLMIILSVPLVLGSYYQESPNQTSYVITGEKTGYFYANYTNVSSGSLWEIKHGNLATYNITIPESCIISNKFASRLFTNFTYPASSYGECYNGVSWNLISSISSGSGSLSSYTNAQLVNDGNWFTCSFVEFPGNWFTPIYPDCSSPMGAYLYEEAVNVYYTVPVVNVTYGITIEDNSFNGISSSVNIISVSGVGGILVKNNSFVNNTLSTDAVFVDNSVPTLDSNSFQNNEVTGNHSFVLLNNTNSAEFVNNNILVNTGYFLVLTGLNDIVTGNTFITAGVKLNGADFASISNNVFTGNTNNPSVELVTGVNDAIISGNTVTGILVKSTGGYAIVSSNNVNGGNIIMNGTLQFQSNNYSGYAYNVTSGNVTVSGDDLGGLSRNLIISGGQVVITDTDNVSPVLAGGNIVLTSGSYLHYPNMTSNTTYTSTDMYPKYMTFGTPNQTEAYPAEGTTTSTPISGLATSEGPFNCSGVLISTQGNLLGNCSVVADQCVCVVKIPYYYESGAYDMNRTMFDSYASLNMDSSGIVVFNQLTSNRKDRNFVTFSGSILGVPNVKCDVPIKIINLGNANYTNVSLIATDLVGSTNSTYKLLASAFRAGNVIQDSVALINNETVQLPFILPVNGSVDLNIWVSAPADLYPQYYSPSAAWTLTLR